ncbi:hypothetical protein X793_00315 [Dehalococcoides mccartyi CG4]|uniref:hypothetical protein n=1 Tax=Dehalococcoides mccartyi TaxID=61435 RepID=UPI0004E04850|nr:hypothetical protein [Dehalococcoides mccartyi]AII58849.1 hypothetical protein X793_00315 [Dehalococcoides mccartyi CG4]
MPRKKAPSIKETREWLDLYESGWSEALLAQRKGRDIRTIRRYLAKAQDERRLNLVESELIKSALAKHQEQLLLTLDNLYSAIALPEPDLSLNSTGNNGRIELNSGRVVVTQVAESTGVAVHLESEDSVLFSLVEEHLDHDLLFLMLNEWKSKLENYVRACSYIKESQTERLSRRGADERSYNIKEKSADEQICKSICMSDLSEFIYKNSLNYIIKNDKSVLTKARERIAINKERGELILKPGNTLLSCPGKEAEYLQKTLELLTEKSLQEHKGPIQQAYRKLEDETSKLKKVIEEIKLCNFIPGECRVCRRLKGQGGLR